MTTKETDEKVNTGGEDQDIDLLSSIDKNELSSMFDENAKEDDEVKGTTKKDTGKEEEKENTKDDPKETKDEAGSKDEEKDESEEIKDKDLDDLESKDDDKGEEEAKVEDKEGEEEQEDTLAGALGDEKEDEPAKIKDYKSLAKEVFGEEIEGDNIDALKTTYQKKLDEAKKELDLSSFPEDAQKVIKHITDNKGSVTDFYTDTQLREFDRFLSQDRKSMYKEVLKTRLANDETLTNEEIQEEVEEKLESIEDDRLKEVTDNYISKIQSERDKRIDSIITEREKAVENEKQSGVETVKKEQESLKSYIDKVEEFEGIPLDDAAKTKLKKQVDSGLVDQVLSENPEKLKIETYLRLRLGDKIEKIKAARAKREKQEAKEEGKRQERQKNHNVKPKDQAYDKSKEDDDLEGVDGFADPSLYSE